MNRINTDQKEEFTLTCSHFVLAVIVALEEFASWLYDPTTADENDAKSIRMNIQFFYNGMMKEDFRSWKNQLTIRNMDNKIALHVWIKIGMPRIVGVQDKFLDFMCLQINHNNLRTDLIS